MTDYRFDPYDSERPIFWILDPADRRLPPIPLPRSDREAVLQWARMMEASDRVIGHTYVPMKDGGSIFVSTVFLGLDLGFAMGGPPILFETMMFDAPFPFPRAFRNRYATWQEAEEGHATAVHIIRRYLELIERKDRE